MSVSNNPSDYNQLAGCFDRFLLRFNRSAPPFTPACRSWFESTQFSSPSWDPSMPTGPSSMQSRCHCAYSNL